MNYSEDDKKRFHLKFEKKGDDDCWEWKNKKNRYGFFYMKKNDLWKTFLAHRVSWEIHSGKNIPPKMMICHTCDNKLCVNPNHLYLGTGYDNNNDTIRRHPNKGNRKKGNECSWTKIPDEELGNIINSSETQTVIAKRYGVHQSVISRIKTGKRKRFSLR